MKTLILVSVFLTMASCEVIVVDPYYDRRDQITGTYQMKEYSETFNSTVRYNVYISKVGSGNDIYLENMYNAGIAVRAQLTGNKVYIPWQVQDGYEIEGVGTVYGRQLTLTYSVYDTYNDSDTDYCSGEAWHQ